MDPLVWLTLFSTIAALSSAAFAWVQAKAATDSRRDAQDAQEKAEAAQKEAMRIAGEARDALGRSADALERSNEIAEKGLPKDTIKWQVTQVAKSRWMAQNVGKLVAHNARIERVAGIVHVDDDAPRTVGPGDSLLFNTLRAGGEQPRIRIIAEAHVDGDPEDYVVEVNIP